MSKQSTIFIGQGLDYEREQSRLHGVDLGALFALGREILFGILQADIVNIPVERRRQQVVARFPDHPAAHLLSAYALRCRGDDAAANEALERARELAAGDHPAAALVPDDAEWRDEPRPPELREVVPGQVWQIPCVYCNDGSPFRFVQLGTLIKLNSGELVYINPVPLGDAAEAVAALGEVTALAVPTAFHGRYVRQVKASFPDAKTIGVSEHHARATELGLRFDATFDEAAPPWRGELDIHHVPGTMFDEFFLLHHPTQTLLVQDMIMFGTPPRDPDSRFQGRLYGWTWGAWERVNFAGYAPLFWNRFDAMRAALRRLRELPFERVTGAHLDWNAAASRDELLSLFDSLDHMSMARTKLRYFWRHPLFLRDLVKFQIRTNRERRRAG